MCLALFCRNGERILSENLIFNLKLLAKDTIAKDAKLKIIPIEGEVWRLKEIEGE